MIVIQCDQLSEEWRKEKCGKPSSSHFKDIVTTKGAPSKSAKAYMYNLAYERLTGKSSNDFMDYNMRRGIENEPKARLLYELHKDVDVQQVGLIYFDNRKLWLCSPDGLVGNEGGIEIKDAKPQIQIDRLLNGWKKEEHYQQIQGSLFTSGRKWWDRVSHCPGLDLLIERYYRDDEFCAKLKIELESFCNELDKLTEKLKKVSC